MPTASRLELLEARQLLAAPPTDLTIGPGSDLYVQASAADPAGNLLVVGTNATSADLDPRAGSEYRISASAVFIARYAPEGRPLWIRTVSNGQDIKIFWVNAVASDAAGNVYLTGALAGSLDFDPGTANHTLTSPNGPDPRGATNAFLWKINRGGSFGWATIVSTANTTYEEGSAIAFDRFGSVYLTGSVPGDARSFLVKFTSAGQRAWSLSLPYGNPTAVAVAPDDCPVIATSGINLRVVKFNARGRFVSHISAAYRTSSDGRLQVNSLDFDRAGNAVLAGAFRGTYDFLPGAGQMLFTPRGLPYNGFVSRIGLDGRFFFAFQLGDSGPDEVTGAAVDDSTGDIYIGGQFSGRVDVNPARFGSTFIDTGDPPEAAQTNSDLFTARYSSAGRLLFATTAAKTPLQETPVGFALVSARTFMAAGEYDPNADQRSIHLYQQSLWS